MGKPKKEPQDRQETNEEERSGQNIKNEQPQRNRNAYYFGNPIMICGAQQEDEYKTPEAIYISTDETNCRSKEENNRPKNNPIIFMFSAQTRADQAKD